MKQFKQFWTKKLHVNFLNDLNNSIVSSYFIDIMLIISVILTATANHSLVGVDFFIYCCIACKSILPLITKRELDAILLRSYLQKFMVQWEFENFVKVFDDFVIKHLEFVF